MRPAKIIGRYDKFGFWVTDGFNSHGHSPHVCLSRHVQACHGGKTDDKCPACKELLTRFEENNGETSSGSSIERQQP